MIAKDKSSRILFLFLLSILIAGAFACVSEPSSTQKLNVITTILPQACFVKKIGEHHLDVETLLSTGQSEHSYDPTPKQIAHLSKAQIFFRTGMPIEETLVKKAQQSYTGLKIVDLRENIPLRTMKEWESHHHEDHARDNHDKAGQQDPHIWMNPRLVKIQAQTIAAALKQADPAHAKEYEDNLSALLTDLYALDAKIAGILAPMKGQTMFVFHPAFGYFADEYGLKQVAIETEGKEPGARQLAQLMEQARKEGIKTIFVQSQFSQKSAQAIAQTIGGRVIALDPLAFDYLENMEYIARQVAAGLLPTQ